MHNDIYQALVSLNDKMNTIGAKVDRLTRAVNNLAREELLMALDLTNLENAVANNTSVDESAKTLLAGLSAKIQELIDASGNTVDPAQLQSIVDGINGSSGSLAAAVAANTPAAPPTT